MSRLTQMARLCVGLVMVSAVAACGSWRVDYPDTITPETSADWNVGLVTVFVPDELTTTEANRFFPQADIVWHGELRGDRRAQVAQIVKEGVSAGGDALTGPKRVSVDVRVLQFHSVSPIAVSRAPTAVHNIRLAIHVRDPQTNQIIAGPDVIVAQLEAWTGAAAAVAATEGRGQRVRIVNHLADVTAGWLAAGPDQRTQFYTLGR